MVANLSLRAHRATRFSKTTSTAATRAAFVAWFAVAPAVVAFAQSGVAKPPPLRTEFQRRTKFEIPVATNLKDESSSASMQIRLYASADRGKTWQQAGAASVKATAFAVNVPRDGDYLFSVRLAKSEDRDKPGATHTANYRAIVDTEPPKLELRARRSAAGEIVANWRASDAHLDHQSFSLTAGREGNLQSVALDASKPAAVDPTLLSGTTAWFPAADAGIVTVRGEVSDRAGNRVVTSVQVALADERASENTTTAAAPDRRANPIADAPPRGYEREVGVERSRDAVEGDSRSTDSQPRTDFGPPPSTGPRFSSVPGESQPWPADERTDSTLDRANRPEGRGGAPKSPAIHQPSNAPTEELPSTPTIQPPVTRRVGPTDDATTTAGSAAANAASARPAPDMPSDNIPEGERPRVLGSRRVSLQYDISSVGPSGVAEVELYSTRDGGRTWNSHGIDPDNHSPFSTTLPGEGMYGFRIAVRNKNRAGGRAPEPGDLPDMWVLVDETKPIAAITGTSIRTTERGRELVIRYEAADARLAARPIALFFSDKPSGPWQTIGVTLANRGAHAWPLDRRLPESVYLRLEVQDEAGNVAAFETASPIALDDREPVGKIRGVDSPAANIARESWPQYR